MSKARAFVVTNWNCGESFCHKLNDGGQVRFIAYGPETCPKTQKKHWQTFLYLNNKVSTSAKNLKKFGGWVGETRCYVYAMNGSFQQNEAYCSKEGELVKLGDEPQHIAACGFICLSLQIAKHTRGIEGRNYIERFECPNVPYQHPKETDQR